MSRTPIPFNTSYAVDPETLCWLWTLPLNGSGYGGTFYAGKRMGAHRASYLMHVGPIPDGFQIDHLCRVRACVNPEHLEPVTRTENQVRGIAGQNVAAIQQAKTACPYGHAYDYVDTRGWRSCRTCRAEARARFQAKGEKAS
jgi:HNH endonuclease